MLGIIIVSLLVVLIGVGVGLALWFSHRNGGGAAGSGAGQLQVLWPDGRVQTLPLPARGQLGIGRESTNRIIVDHHLVSRRHARIVGDGTGWALEDTDSANGTFLNGRSVVYAHLSSGDQVDIGPVQIRVMLPDAAAGQASPVQRSIAAPGPATNSGSTSRQIFGHYAVVRALGEGGFGKIMLAQDQRDRRLVALKLLNTYDDYLTTKFRQEGAIKLDHQHIARIYEAGDLEGRPYIAMEYVHGTSLRKLLEGRPLPVDTALTIAGQMLAALEYAHRNQVIHRDIKPENIMLSAQQGVKIIDFGIAKVLSAVTRTRDGMVIGTPQYMSYEQAMGQPVNITSDLYATAIVIYEMLTANVPFGGENSLDVIRQHQNALPLPPARLNSAIPAQVDAAILRALEKEGARRFQTAQEFAGALGCVPGRLLPPEIAAEVSRLTPPVVNERSNAADLLTRAPAAPGTGHLGGRAALRVISGPRRGQVIPLAPSQVIGRMEIDPSDGTISRQHFRIERQNGTSQIIDSSTYGTVVDGVRLQPHNSYPLRPGAQIQTGQTILVYESTQ